MSISRTKLPPKEREIAQRVLNKARKTIEQYGWVQRRFGNKSVGYCLWGAIEAALQEEREKISPAFRPLFTNGNISCNREAVIIPSVAWNDNKYRTKQEVLALLSKPVEELIL